MGKIDNMVKGCKFAVSRGGLLIRKHSPEILLTVGIGLIIGGTVKACIDSKKIEPIMDDLESKKDEDGKNTTEDIVEAVVSSVRVYAPSGVIVTAGIGCVIGGHVILQKRNVALAAAYKALEISYDNYRKRVVDDYGKQVDRDFRSGIKRSKETIVDENGNETEVDKVEKIDNEPFYSEHSRFFDACSSCWSKDADYNYAFLKNQQMWANERLKSRGHVFLNEVYDDLGFPRTQAGSIIGWVYDPKAEEDQISFGFDMVYDHINQYFTTGTVGNVCMLDFNIDGVIWDRI